MIIKKYYNYYILALLAKLARFSKKSISIYLDRINLEKSRLELEISRSGFKV